MTKTTKVKEDSYMIQEIKKLPKDTVVYTCLKHVSRSGMLRIISLHYVDPKDHRIISIRDDLIGKYDYKQEGFRVSGCGMDMGFSLVYHLSSTLFNDGYYFKQQWL